MAGRSAASVAAAKPPSATIVATLSVMSMRFMSESPLVDGRPAAGLSPSRFAYFLARALVAGLPRATLPGSALPFEAS